jgi:hypothetical protein
MKNIEIITEEYERAEVGKRFKMENKCSEVTTWDEWKRLTSEDTMRFFKGLGGSETLQGNRLVSIDPTGTLKTVRTYKIVSA